MERLETTFAAFGVEISAEKTKLMAFNADGFDTDIRVCVEKLERVKSFKYLESVVADERSRSEIISKIAQTTGAMKKQTYLE